MKLFGFNLRLWDKCRELKQYQLVTLNQLLDSINIIGLWDELVEGINISGKIDNEEFNYSELSKKKAVEFITKYLLPENYEHSGRLTISYSGALPDNENSMMESHKFNLEYLVSHISKIQLKDQRGGEFGKRRAHVYYKVVQTYHKVYK